MPCDLEAADVGTFPGQTLFSKKNARCKRPTAVYLSPKHIIANKSASTNSSVNSTLDVVIWLHGFFVKDHKFLLHNDPTRVREQVRDSNKDVILIAPFLGYEYSLGRDAQGKSLGVAGDFNAGLVGAEKWGEQFLDEVLAGLSRFQNPGSDPPPRLDIRNLVIACHSGGGVGMRSLVGTLGKHRAKLKGCWGFDCLYTTKPEDDATFWFKFASKKDACPIDVTYGPSTLGQSVKLDLLAQGLATPEGNRAVPPRAKLNGVNVSVGHYDVFGAFGQMVRVNDLDPAFVNQSMIPPDPGLGPRGRPKEPQDGSFLKTAIANVRNGFRFPEDIHYMIARGGFYSRLSNASFLG